ncbi:MAG: retroviral-like aspartic protease family protein [Myxococcota bacterium]
MAHPRPPPASSAHIFRVDEQPAATAQPVCYRHYGTPAETTCFTCLEPICRVCTVHDFEGAQCAACLGDKRRRRRVAALSVVASAAVTGVILGVGAFKYNVGTLGSYDYGPHTREIRQLRARLDQSPCNKRHMLDLAERMLGAGDTNGVVTRVRTFQEQCGDWPRLTWLTYEAHKRAGAYDQAIADATLLIDDGPEDKDFRWWRGLAHEMKGDLTHAVVDYTQAQLLQPALSNIPFNLASALDQLDRPCEALLPLELFLLHHDEHRDDERVAERMMRLEVRCPQRRAEGGAELGVDRRVEATVGAARLKLVVDPVAPLVVLSGADAERAGVKLTDPTRYILRTSHGPVHAQRGVVERVATQGASATQVEVAVAETLPAGVEGLLGGSFLARYDVEHDEDDTGRPLLVLEPRNDEAD